MPMKKSQLKKIVKECLMEILQEGLNESVSLPVNLNFVLKEQKTSPRQVTEVFTRPVSSQQPSSIDSATRQTLRQQLAPDLGVAPPPPTLPRPSQSALDQPVGNLRQRMAESQSFQQITSQQPSPTPAAPITETIKQIAPDDVMADIFADTMATTLREQDHGDEIGPTEDAAAAAAAASDPSQLFAEAAGNWANLAFSRK